MTTEKLLYKVYKRRSTLVNIFLVFTIVLSALFAVIAFSEIFGNSDNMDNIVSGNWTEVDFKTFFTWLGFGMSILINLKHTENLLMI